MSGHEVNILTKDQREALLSGATILIDELFMDFFSIKRGEAIGDHMVLAECLPRQFRHYYNELFVKKFIVCVIRIADRIATWEAGIIPASTAECIALGAIIEQAKALLEMKVERDGRYSEVDFSFFEDIAFPDLDFEFLFDPAFDGIEDTQIAEDMGMVLKPSEWFKPIYGSVHPYVGYSNI